MGRTGRDRSPRRQRFDDDAFGQSDTPEPFRRTSREDTAGPAVDATVKWFNAAKGFGFVELADGSGDAFLHIGALQNAGYDVVAPETKLRLRVGQGQKGRQVTEVLEVDASSGGAPQASRRPSPRMQSDRGRTDSRTASDVEGTVKWFNPDKGFGFAVAKDGDKDVFIHISVVEKTGMRALDEGQRVAMRVVKTQKGREAISLTPID
jgi:cold shock protein